MGRWPQAPAHAAAAHSDPPRKGPKELQGMEMEVGGTCAGGGGSLQKGLCAKLREEPTPPRPLRRQAQARLKMKSVCAPNSRHPTLILIVVYPKSPQPLEGKYFTCGLPGDIRTRM